MVRCSERPLFREEIIKKIVGVEKMYSKNWQSFGVNSTRMSFNKGGWVVTLLGTLFRVQA